MTENELSHLVVGCAMRVHSALGPGLLESAYEACLQYELIKSGLRVEAQKPLPFGLPFSQAGMWLSRRLASREQTDHRSKSYGAAR